MPSPYLSTGDGKERGAGVRREDLGSSMCNNSERKNWLVDTKEEY